MISDFRGKYAFLSNFADSPLYYKGLKFAMQRQLSRHKRQQTCRQRRVFVLCGR